jgi:hypothetical protein
VSVVQKKRVKNHKNVGVMGIHLKILILKELMFSTDFNLIADFFAKKNLLIGPLTALYKIGEGRARKKLTVSMVCNTDALEQVFQLY